MTQYGTIEIKSSSGTVSVPVFSLGSSGGGVYEVVRVQTANGTGFLPLTSQSEAAFPFLKVKTENFGVLAAHDKASTGANVVTETWESYAAGSSNPGPWSTNSLSVSNTRSYEGSRSFGGSNGGFKTYLENTWTETAVQQAMGFYYYETGDNKNTQVHYLDGSGNTLFVLGTNNPQPEYEAGSGQGSFGTGTYGKWYPMTVRSWDWSNNQADVTWNGGNRTTIDFLRSASGLGGIKVLHDVSGNWGGGADTCEFWIDNIDYIQ